MVRPVPTTRRERLRQAGERARTFNRQLTDNIETRIRDSRLVRFFQGLVVGIRVFTQIISFSVVLAAQVVVFAFYVSLIILGFIAAYYAFRYVLLFAIWIQNSVS